MFVLGTGVWIDGLRPMPNEVSAVVVEIDVPLLVEFDGPSVHVKPVRTI
jgi:hypothetical protein